MGGLKHILLIDDDEDDAEIFREALTDAGMNTAFEYSSNGRMIIEMLAKKQSVMPDVIFLDINMPSFDGWQCLQAIKGHLELRKIPVIMYSTTSSAVETKKAIQLGADRFMSKASSYVDLLKQLKQVITAL